MAAEPRDVPSHRRAWTDERIDDLAQTVSDGFAQNHAEHRAFREEMRDGFASVNLRFEQVDARFDKIDDKVDSRFDKIDARFDEVDARFDEVDDKFDARFDKVDDRYGSLESRIYELHRTLSIGLFGLTATVIASVIAAMVKF